MSAELIVRQDSALAVSITPTALAQRDEVLAFAKLVTVVKSNDDQQWAIDALDAVNTLLRAVEAQREEIKRPVLLYGKKIDETAKGFREDRSGVESLSAAKLRIERLLSDWVSLQNARIRAEQQCFNNNLLALEQEREAKIAKATSIEEVDAIREEYCIKVAEMGPQPSLEKAEGQINKSDVDIVVEDVHLLARMHPNLVTITPKKQEIKDAIKAGVKISGVRWTPIVRVQTKVKKEKALTV